MTIPSEPSPDPLATFNDLAFGISDLLLFGLLIFLLGASALFAGAEVAYISITNTERDRLRKNTSRGARLTEKLLEKPKELIATILIGKNVLNVAFVIVAGILLTKTLLLLNIPFWVTQVINGIVITLFLLFVGESYPKTVAFRNKASYATFMAPYIYMFHIMPPFSWLIVPISKSASILEKRAKRKGFKISSDTLETVLTLSQNADESKDDFTMLRGMLNFGNTDVKQIMCPRMDVVGVEEQSTLAQVMKIVVDAGYSRLPVYKDTFDEVIGIVYVKDLLPHLSLGDLFNWRELIREPFYVPENKKIDDLLKEFQLKKAHLAIVIDEYGGTCGIVTLEDVLEEIVGEIIDEYDDDHEAYIQLNETTYLFEGSTSLSDFYKILDIDGRLFEELKEDAESIGGFIVQNAGRIPKIKESISIDNIKLIVDSSDKKRVKKVKVIVGS